MILSEILLRVRRSSRAFARAPGLTLALLLTIALGVGSNAAVYGFLQGLTHPVSVFRGTDRVVSIFAQDRNREAGPLSLDEYQSVAANSALFEWVGAVRIRPEDTTINGRTEVSTVAAITPNLAGFMTIPLGNGAVLAHRQWESDFDGNGNTLGLPIRIDGADFKIGGIAPAQVDGLYSDQSINLWVESTPQDLASGDRNKRDLWIVARLRSGLPIVQAESALRSGSPALASVSVVPFTGIAPARALGIARVSMILDLSAGAVFFIACINVASFLLGRALKRSHETSLRIALGGTRVALLWDLFADSVVISIAGGAVGLLLGILTARALPAFLFEEDAQRLSFAPHLFPILAASTACIVITILCGMLPVLGTRTDRPWILLQRETSSPSKALLRLRSGLVVLQISVCCMLVIGAALLFNGLQTALKTSAGQRLGNPLLVTVQAMQRPDGPEIDVSYFSRVEQKLRSVAALSPMAWTSRLPGSQPSWRTFSIQQAATKSRDIAMDIAWLTPKSLDLLDNLPVAGRMFKPGDQGRRVGVVNEQAATQLFGKQSVGIRIDEANSLPVEIIGVMKRKPDGAKQAAPPTIYFGYLDQPDAPPTIKDARFLVPLTPPVVGVELSANSVSARYFMALGMSLVAGQSFHDEESPGAGRVAVINQEAADVYFNGKALGAAVIDDSGVRTEIIGVVRSQAFGTFEQHAEPSIYFPMRQDHPARMTLLLKAPKWNGKVAADLRRRIDSVPGRNASPILIRTLDEQLAQSGLAPLRIATLIGGAAAAMALLLSILGLVSAQNDAERRLRPDRALRVALGARRRHIVLLVMTNAGRLALVGTVLGTLLSFVSLRILIAGVAPVSSPPYQVWLVAPLLPAIAILIASLYPAQRASIPSPALIMRDR